MSRISFHWTYLRIAYTHLGRAKRADRLKDLAWEKVLKVGLDPGLQEQAVYAELHFREEKSHAIITSIIFSALMLEAYINNMARLKLATWYRENLDKLDLAAKWVMVLKTIYGDVIKPGDGIVGKLDRVQKIRNRLVHARSIYFDCPDPKDLAALNKFREGFEKHRMEVERADEAFQTCIEAIEIVAKIDPTFESSDYAAWIRWRDIEIDEFAGMAAAFEAELPPASPPIGS